ncbi:MAG: hypothetical protein ACE5FZ_01385 [Nitrospiria bacterium]
MILFIFVLAGVGVASGGDFSVGGNYLGLINSFDVDNRTPTDPEREQFDFAANIDFEWTVRPDVLVTIQLQGGTGGGSLGFVGPQPAVTDLNVTKAFKDLNLVVVLGSFDTPFGEQTASLTNNADSFRNPFLLNSLFYSAFGGTVGTLNTLGAMGTLSRPFGDLTVALTNGTSEDSGNPDGNFEWVISAGTDAGVAGLRVAGSLMRSDDLTAAGGPNGSFEADFRGWMLDGRYVINKNAAVKGYVGEVEYGDINAATKDEVGIWMAEATYEKEQWQLAIRVSGWDPEDADGLDPVNGTIPNPGLNEPWPVGGAGAGPARVDQSVQRIQLGASWSLSGDLVAKLEVVEDDYDKAVAGDLGGVDGVILLLNGRF